MLLALSIILIHIIGAITTIIIHCKNGDMEYAAKHGDGVRFATPSDIVFIDLFFWEIQFILFVFTSIENVIDNYFKRKYTTEN